jgi:hypothetical protein
LHSPKILVKREKQRCGESGWAGMGEE